jgi:hypothetical protein
MGKTLDPPMRTRLPGKGSHGGNVWAIRAYKKRFLPSPGQFPAVSGGIVKNLLKEGEVRSVKKDSDKVQAVRARQRALGLVLRRMYDEVVHEPVPEEFLELLRQIDTSNGGDSKKKDDQR